MHTIHHGNAVAWSREYAGEPFHALLCDAPYEMGFMSKSWDASGVAFDPETWRAFARVLYPGAYLLVFAGTLNDDLISIAMRQAGLRKHHKMLSWAYGSGFPKATRLDTQIDKRAGAERKVLSEKPAYGIGGNSVLKGHKKGATAKIAAPATDLARTWQGHRYGQQALKPALEPILVFQKPYDTSPIDSITTTGAGALNIDGGRIGDEELTTQGGQKFKDGIYGRFGDAAKSTHNGRWPANLLLSHAPDCNGTCVPECPIERLGAQSGESKAGTQEGVGSGGIWSGISNKPVSMSHGDTGTAARYFHQSNYLTERLEQQDALAYYAKAGRAEREAGLDPIQVALMRDFYGIGDDTDFDETTINDGRHKSIDNPYQRGETERGETERRNTHPTVKPVALCRYLATLLLPPAAYAPRRLFIPFAGVASELIGAMLAGWEHVDGVERDEIHVKIARARMAYWQQQRHKFNGGQAIKIKSSKTPEQQSSMFDL